MGNNQSLQVGPEALSETIAGLLAFVFVRLLLIALALVAVLAALVLLLISVG